MSYILEMVSVVRHCLTNTKIYDTVWPILKYTTLFDQFQNIYNILELVRLSYILEFARQCRIF
jgi:hypothetical protein